MREREVERHLVRRVKVMRGEVRKVKWIGRRGAPDRYVMLRGVEPFWVELKASGKRATDAQTREHQRMWRFGVHVYVCDSVESVNDMLSGH